MFWLEQKDPETYQAIMNEVKREQDRLILIASENYVSPSILEAVGSVMTNKYAEGYPGRRYYAGCEAVDQVEELAISRAKTLFGAEHVNVQPHSGSQANMAVYLAAIKPGDTLLGMNLAHGGHLTHGSQVSFSGHYYKSVFYGVDPMTGLIDYDGLRTQAREHRPRIIIAGASSYPRTIDFAPFRAIADEVGATLLVDMAHIAGLVAAGLHPSPFPVADFVTTSTHKTLRGPRGGMAFSREPLAKALDKAVFPMMQGGPLMHVVAGKAVMLSEALAPSFRDYMARVLENCRVLARSLSEAGYSLLTGGTDNHLLLIDLRPQGLSGKEAEHYLSQAGIFVNKNAVPFDDKPPTITSGIRIGTPAATTRGLGPEEMLQVGGWIRQALESRGKEEVLRRISGEVGDLLSRFPIYGEIRKSPASPRS
ncbi:MAG: serine hydroxymethyltransferase [Nitrospirae bacterium]|nr:serine hydroxymethyltransferase [Nitrospirota bacterium]